MPSYTASPNFTQGMDPILDGTTCGKRCDVPVTAIGSIATILTPASGKKYRLLGGLVSVSAAVNILLEDNAAGTANFIFRIPAVAVNTPVFFSLGNGYLAQAADNVLKATSSGAANITGTLFYSEE